MSADVVAHGDYFHLIINDNYALRSRSPPRLLVSGRDIGSVKNGHLKIYDYGAKGDSIHLDLVKPEPWRLDV
jgi:hypothetical protein